VTRAAIIYAVAAAAALVVILAADWLVMFGWPLPFAALYGVLP
jgi:hypothetical protein